MDETPVLKLTKLTIKKEDRAEYIREAEHNMHESIPAEIDTLILGSGHEDAQGTINYTIELFRSPIAEDLHIAADHADSYAETIKKIAQDKKTWDLNAQIVTTKPNKALNSYADEFVMHLNKIEVKKGEEEKFSHAIKKEITTAMAEEVGVEMIIAGNNKSNENEWFVLEVYANDNEYKAHLDSEHFADYQNEIKDMIESRESHELVRDTLASQGAVVLD